MTEEKKEEPYFNKEMQKKAIDWVTQKCGNLLCECCGTKQWQLGQHLVVPINFEGSVTLGGAVYPHFLLICSNCGNTKLFNAMATGILQKDANVEKKV